MLILAGDVNSCVPGEQHAFNLQWLYRGGILCRIHPARIIYTRFSNNINEFAFFPRGGIRMFGATHISFEIVEHLPRPPMYST